MPIDSSVDESFNSFLAGVLYVKNCISSKELTKLMDDFESLYNTMIVSDDSSFLLPLYIGNSSITLKADYNEVIDNDGIKMTVKDYLYSLTSSRVRSYFKIPLREKLLYYGRVGRKTLFRIKKDSNYN